MHNRVLLIQLAVNNLVNKNNKSKQSIPRENIVHALVDELCSTQRLTQYQDIT